MQDLHVQLDALYDLKGFLEMFKSDLESQLNGYRNRKSNLIDSGISKQVAIGYESYYHINEGYLKQLIRNFEEDDIPYIMRQIEVLHDAIYRAGGSYQG